MKLEDIFESDDGQTVLPDELRGKPWPKVFPKLSDKQLIALMKERWQTPARDSIQSELDRRDLKVNWKK